MAKISNVKRLLKEDFPAENRDLVDKLAYVLNPLLDQIVAAFNKNINVDNLSRELVQVIVVNTIGVESYKVGSVHSISTNGDVNPSVQIKTKLTAKVVGINVIRVDNITNPGTYPINAVGLSWSSTGQLITLNKVTGLKDGDRYNLLLELIS